MKWINLLCAFHLKRQSKPNASSSFMGGRADLVRGRRNYAHWPIINRVFIQSHENWTKHFFLLNISKWTHYAISRFDFHHRKCLIPKSSGVLALIDSGWDETITQLQQSVTSTSSLELLRTCHIKFTCSVSSKPNYHSVLVLWLIKSHSLD